MIPTKVFFQAVERNMSLKLIYLSKSYEIVSFFNSRNSELNKAKYYLTIRSPSERWQLCSVELI